MGASGQKRLLTVRPHVSAATSWEDPVVSLFRDGGASVGFGGLSWSLATLVLVPWASVL